MDISAWLPGIVVAIIAAAASIVNAFRTSKTQERQKQMDLEDRAVDHWKEFAKTQQESADTLQDRLDRAEESLREGELARLDTEARLRSLEIKDQERSFEIRQISSLLTTSLRHVAEWWQWHDSGQNPPPPARPTELLYAIREYGATDDLDTDDTLEGA